MPAYNAEQYIGLAIESILNQTYKNFEFIIVEDCSSDNTLKAIREYKDERIILLQNEENKGIAFSTNCGLNKAKGRYVALMDDDDIATAERFAIQVNYLENHEEIHILGGKSDEIDSQGTLIRHGLTPRYNPKYIKSILLFHCMDFRNGTTMMRKDFIDEHNLRYRENCYGMQDYKFFIEASKYGNISAVNDLLLYYRVHEGNETKRRMTEYEQERKAKYAEFQRESLAASGFKISEAYLAIINQSLNESDNKCEGQEELKALYKVFNEIMRQAHEMNIDYYVELEQYCKALLTEKFRSLIKFV
jgi:glycosyltransferase involved in cell wall biosynthesis